MSDITIRGRYLFGPGPSPVSGRVMRALSTPILGHLDPQFMTVLDDLRGRLGALFRSGDGSLNLAISGTGTAGMEAAVANLVGSGSRVLVVVTGYFGDRLAQMCERYGATVQRLEVEWGRACDPEAVRRALGSNGADLVAAVHAETSTGVLNPIDGITAAAAEHGALTIVDAVTSLGAHQVEAGGWGVDACYSCTQKGIGAPSGLAPLTFSKSALERAGSCRSFYVDLQLLQDYWLRRKYHHTISAPLIYALREALAEIEDEGLEERWRRHREHHELLVRGLNAMGLELLPPPGERLWTLNAVKVPAGVNEAAVRTHLLQDFDIEIGAGLGPLAGRIWRIGLMGSGSTRQTILLLLGALEQALRASGAAVRPGAGTAAVVDGLTSPAASA